MKIRFWIIAALILCGVFSFLNVQSIYAASSVSAESVSNVQQAEEFSGSIQKIEFTGGISSGVRILIGVVQLIISFILGLCIVLLSFWVFLKLTKGIDEEEQLKSNNTAVGIMMGSFIFGVTVLLKRSLYPIFSLMKDLALSPQTTASSYLAMTFFSIGYIVLSLIVALIIAITALKLLERLTKKIEEMNEIRKNNTAIAIFFAAIFISLCFFIEEGLHALLITLIPGPQINIL